MNTNERKSLRPNLLFVGDRECISPAECDTPIVSESAAYHITYIVLYLYTYILETTNNNKVYINFIHAF